MAGKLLVVIATYNERENLPRLLERVLAEQPDAHILVVDDNSPDGTGRLADELAARDDRIKVMHRSGKLGLGTAIVAGMRYAIDRGYELVLVMDADFSHHPRYVPALAAGADGYDVTVGSRYVPGGGVPDWPVWRRFMSRGINLYARVLLSLPARDVSGAFRCYKTSVLRRVAFDRIVSRGYSFQEEILWRCHRVGARLGEVPIVFEDRRFGRSKINHREALAALLILLWLGLGRMFRWS
jgi:dolichol-phosphate mannosyltransferase